MQSKRALWIAEVLIGGIGVILAFMGHVAEAVACAAMIAATMDKLVTKE